MESTYEQALESWLKRAQSIVDEGRPGHTLSVMNGRKYNRIVCHDPSRDGGSAFCFVEKSTGAVLFPASYKSPSTTTAARGNIYELGKEGVSAYGANYLRM